MKRADLIFTSILVPVDFAMLTFAGILSYFLRFQTFSDVVPVLYEIDFSQFLNYTLLVAVWYILIFAISGLYQIGFYRIRNEIPKIITACSAAILTVILIIFFIPDLFSSRFIVLSFWALSIGCIVISRLILRAVRYLFLKIGVGAHRIALIGSETVSKKLKDYFNDNVGKGYKVVACVTTLDVVAQKHFSDLARKHNLEEIFLVDTAVAQGTIQNILDFAEIKHLGVRYATGVMGGSNVEITTIAGVPMVEIKRTRLDGWGRIIKRLFDFVVSLILIIITSPIMFLTAIAVRLESKGPALYKNERVGSKGNFLVYKFRSMYMQYCTGTTDNPSMYDKTGKAGEYEEELAKEKSARQGPVFKILNDHRRTRVGRFIERTSLDEFPQLFNVLLGNMSLVGPRPHMPVQVAKYKKHHHKVFAIKPGVTGMAQISGRSDLDFEDEVRLDTYYIENWSLLMDLAILIKTPWAVISRRSSV
ncbi:MAG: sugar transferase [bacterium]|nr:sugar transferase [bacterium]